MGKVNKVKKNTNKLSETESGEEVELKMNMPPEKSRIQMNGENEKGK